MSKLTDRVRSTMKSGDTEGAFELYVTRTPGYLWALLFKWLHVHPIAVTLMSIVLGALSGWFFYFDDLRMTAIGIALLVWANWYDCADGQLARMTGKKTLIGRILDGFAGDVWFFFIYLFICLRLTDKPIPFCPEYAWGVWVWLLAAWAGLRCHGRQCAIGDYYRNVHVWFCDPEVSELTTKASVQAEYDGLRWRSRNWFRKLYLFFYAIYCDGQEAQAPTFQRLYQKLTADAEGRQTRKEALADEFRRDSKPLMKWTNVLTFDTRVAVLFASLLVGHPWVYFLFEAFVLEGIRYWLIHRHESICKKYLDR